MKSETTTAHPDTIDAKAGTGRQPLMCCPVAHATALLACVPVPGRYTNLHFLLLPITRGLLGAACPCSLPAPRAKKLKLLTCWLTGWLVESEG